MKLRRLIGSMFVPPQYRLPNQVRLVIIVNIFYKILDDPFSAVKWSRGPASVAAAGSFAVSRGQAVPPNPVAPASADGTSPASSDSVYVAQAALHNMDLHFATAAVRPLVRSVRATGVIAFNDLRMAQPSPPARGRIQSIEVAVGQPVQACQRLALLDNYDLGDTRSRIAALQASLVQARAEASAAQAAYKRAEELVRIDRLAQSELERRRAEVARTDAVTRTRQPNWSSGRRRSSGRCRSGRKMSRPATSPWPSRASELPRRDHRAVRRHHPFHRRRAGRPG